MGSTWHAGHPATACDTSRQALPFVLLQQSRLAQSCGQARVTTTQLLFSSLHWMLSRSQEAPAEAMLCRAAAARYFLLAEAGGVVCSLCHDSALLVDGQPPAALCFVGAACKQVAVPATRKTSARTAGGASNLQSLACCLLLLHLGFELRTP